MGNCQSSLEISQWPAFPNRNISGIHDAIYALLPPPVLRINGVATRRKKNEGLTSLTHSSP